MQCDNFEDPAAEHMGEKHNKIAKAVRNNYYYKNLIPLPIQDQSMFPRAKDHPIVFEEVYVKDKSDYEAEEDARSNLTMRDLALKNNDNAHLIILVHGF